MGIYEIEYLIPVVYAPDGVPVPWGYRLGIGEQDDCAHVPTICGRLKANELIRKNIAIRNEESPSPVYGRGVWGEGL